MLSTSAALNAVRKRLGDDEDADAERCNLARERLRPALERGLAGRVAADGGERHLLALAAHLHDRTRATLPQVGQRGAHIGGRAEQVLLVHGPQRDICDLFGGADLSGAGIVDEHVDTPEHLQRPLHDRGGSRRVAHIVLDCMVAPRDTVAGAVVLKEAVPSRGGVPLDGTVPCAWLWPVAASVPAQP